jgi:hypothetical protein
MIGEAAFSGCFPFFVFIESHPLVFLYPSFGFHIPCPPKGRRIPNFLIFSSPIL